MLSLFQFDHKLPHIKKALCHSDMVNAKEISYIIINLGPGMKFQVYLK